MRREKKASGMEKATKSILREVSQRNRRSFLENGKMMIPQRIITMTIQRKPFLKWVSA